MRATLVAGVAALVLAVLVPARRRCAGSGCPAAWAHAAGRRSPNKIQAPVYCPTWMPNPLDAKIGGQYIDINSVAKDRSYLISFLEHGDVGSGDVHVNFRGYPGATKIPTCTTVILERQEDDPRQDAVLRRPRPACAPRAGSRATVYRVNQDADQWHILLAWKHAGSLYTVSEHVIKPYTTATVVKNLDRLLAGPRARPPARLMRLTRRRFLGGAAAAAVGGAGIYELVDQLAACAEAPGRRARTHAARSSTCSTSRTIESEGVEVLVPPLHSEVVTATVEGRRPARGAARPRATRSPSSTREYPLDPAGLGVTVAWGLPYFEHASRAQAKAHLPFDRRARQAGAAADAPLPERSARHDPRGERRRRPPAQRPPRAHRRRAQGALRRPAVLHGRRASAAASRAAASTASRACRRRWRWRPAFPAPT